MRDAAGGSWRKARRPDLFPWRLQEGHRLGTPCPWPWRPTAAGLCLPGTNRTVCVFSATKVGTICCLLPCFEPSPHAETQSPQ